MGVLILPDGPEHRQANDDHEHTHTHNHNPNKARQELLLAARDRDQHQVADALLGQHTLLPALAADRPVRAADRAAAPRRH